MACLPCLLALLGYDEDAKGPANFPVRTGCSVSMPNLRGLGALYVDESSALYRNGLRQWQELTAYSARLRNLVIQSVPAGPVANSYHQKLNQIDTNLKQAGGKRLPDGIFAKNQWERVPDWYNDKGTTAIWDSEYKDHRYQLAQLEQALSRQTGAPTMVPPPVAQPEVTKPVSASGEGEVYKPIETPKSYGISPSSWSWNPDDLTKADPLYSPAKIAAIVAGVGVVAAIAYLAWPKKK